eukprot:1185494-Pyramimonas_sp.AAC.1
MPARRTGTCCLVRSAIAPQPKSLENSAWKLSSSRNQCSGPLRIANIEDSRVRSTSSRSVVDQALCAVPANATSEACNTAPCVVFTWVAGGWGECDAPCGGGQTTRTVEC